jgi:hypothetical protein
MVLGRLRLIVVEVAVVGLFVAALALGMGNSLKMHPAANSTNASNGYGNAYGQGVCKPGFGYGDKNHCHFGPPGQFYGQGTTFAGGGATFAAPQGASTAAQSGTPGAGSATVLGTTVSRAPVASAVTANPAFTG